MRGVVGDMSAAVRFGREGPASPGTEVEAEVEAENNAAETLRLAAGGVGVAGAGGRSLRREGVRVTSASSASDPLEAGREDEEAEG